MRFFFDIAIAFLVAAVTGIASAWLAVDHAPLFGGLRAGPWTAWPKAGSPDADPYDLAAAARQFELPLGAAEGLTFIAATDDTGTRLAGGCTYQMSGTTPPAQVWTLTAYSSEGRLMPNPDGRFALNSREILRRADGSFTIAIAASVARGNWLPVGVDSAFQLRLRLYDTPLTSTARPTTIVLPAISKISCP